MEDLSCIVEPVVEALVVEGVLLRGHIKVVDIALQLLSEELQEDFHGARVTEVRLVVRSVGISKVLMYVSQEVGDGVAQRG